MPTVLDVTADQPPAGDLRAVQGLTAEEAATLAEELTAYHHYFAPFFYLREQRKWAEIYLRGRLTADVPHKNVEAMALRLLGVGTHAERQVRALQQFIGEGAWDDQAILAEHQRLVNGNSLMLTRSEHLGSMFGRASNHCQVLTSLKSAEASRALRVAISLGV